MKITSLFLILASFIFSLFIMEGIVRIFFKDEIIPPGEFVEYKKGSKGYSDSVKEYVAVGGELGYMHNPDSEEFDKRGIFKKSIKKGGYKILALGDSVTDPIEYCSYPNGYAFELEKILRKKYKKDINVMVAGCVGYNSAQEAAYLERFGASIKPDMILLAFINNDFDLSQEYRDYKDKRIIIYSRPKDIPELIDLGRWTYPVLEHSYLVRLVFLRIADYLKTIRKEKYFKMFDPVYNKNQNALFRIKRAADKLNAKFLIVHFPYFRNFKEYKKDSVWKIHLFVRKFCQDNRVEYIDLLKSYSSFDPQSVCLEKIDDPSSIPGHPNALGHRIAGKAIAEFIEKNRLIQ